MGDEDDMDTRLARWPSQVVRYCFGGSVLRGSKEAEVVPDCPCGAARVFEAQLMPTLLFNLKIEEQIAQGCSEAMDWTHVAVYTCADNCGFNLSADGVYGCEHVCVEMSRDLVVARVEMDEPQVDDEPHLA